MRTRTSKQQHRASGFTLIEMLIAVGLLVLMMSIFAQIFSLATESLVRQRGIGQNDQKARGLFITLNGDLKKISYSALPGEDGITPMLGDASATEYVNANPGTDPDWALEFSYDGQEVDSAHQGYVYISENDPDDDTDDVLQFTVDARRNHPRNRDDTAFFGRAQRFSDTSALEDQPDMDDGRIDDASQSDFAEISYFMRKGKLYRRVVLVRDPLAPFPRDTDRDDEAQPNNGALPAGDLMSSYPVGFGQTRFYNDFDFSAHFEAGIGHAQFHGTLSNDPGTTAFPLGRPEFRFGFHPSDGRPMEYYSGSGGREFIGRHLHAETSSSSFTFPQTNQGRGFLASDSNANTELNNNGVIPKFNDGERAGEDILMSNVVSFDVRVWDEARQSYVNLGYDDSGSTGSSHYGVNQRYEFTTDAGTVIETAGYGDRAQGTDNYDYGANNIFDTWHPDAIAERFDGTPGRNITQTMYRPLKFRPTADYSTWDRNTQALIWDPSTDVSVSTGDVMVPSETYYTNFDSMTAPLRAFRIPVEFRNVVAFRAIVAGGSEQVIDTSIPYDFSFEPDWEAATSLTEFKSGGYESDRFTDPNNPNVQWEPIYNLQPLKSMVITVRFRDQGSDQIRQVTVIHTFAR